jgi:hypothetical protein
LKIKSATGVDEGKIRFQISASFGDRKNCDKTYSTHKSFVSAFSILVVNRQAFIFFHSLQQVADFNIGISIMAVFDFTSLAEEGIGFIKQQDGTFPLLHQKLT